MSKQRAYDFLQRVSEDDQFRSGLEHAVSGRADTLKATVAQAAKDGYEFTESQLEAAIVEALGRGAGPAGGAAGELAETELDSVAGGFNPQPTPPAISQPADNYLRDLFSQKVRLRF